MISFLIRQVLCKSLALIRSSVLYQECGVSYSLIVLPTGVNDTRLPHESGVDRF